MKLSSVQRFVLKEILLDAASGATDRRYGRTRSVLFHYGLITAPWCGELTAKGRDIAKQVLRAEIERRARLVTQRRAQELAAAARDLDNPRRTVEQTGSSLAS